MVAQMPVHAKKCLASEKKKKQFKELHGYQGHNIVWTNDHMHKFYQLLHWFMLLAFPLFNP